MSFPTPGQHNRPLIHQISAPALPANQDLNHPVTSSPDSNESKYHITLTPCTESHEKYDKSPSTDLQKQTLSTSLENIVKHINPRTTTWVCNREKINSFQKLILLAFFKFMIAVVIIFFSSIK